MAGKKSAKETMDEWERQLAATKDQVVESDPGRKVADVIGDAKSGLLNSTPGQAISDFAGDAAFAYKHPGIANMKDAVGFGGVANSAGMLASEVPGFTKEQLDQLRAMLANRNEEFQFGMNGAVGDNRRLVNGLQGLASPDPRNLVIDAGQAAGVLGAIPGSVARSGENFLQGFNNPTLSKFNPMNQGMAGDAGRAVGGAANGLLDAGSSLYEKGMDMLPKGSNPIVYQLQKMGIADKDMGYFINRSGELTEEGKAWLAEKMGR